MPEEQIAEVVGDRTIGSFGVWPENQAALDVFLDCHWDRQIGGFGGSAWLGIASREIRATAEMQDRPRDQWPALLQKVRIVVATVRPGLNRLDNDK